MLPSPSSSCYTLVSVLFRSVLVGKKEEEERKSISRLRNERERRVLTLKPFPFGRSGAEGKCRVRCCYLVSVSRRLTERQFTSVVNLRRRSPSPRPFIRIYNTSSLHLNVGCCCCDANCFLANDVVARLFTRLCFVR